MSQLSDYAENALINALLRSTAYTSTTVYLALFTTATSDAATGTEVTGGSYARQSITFGAPSNGVAANTVAVTFTAMPAATVTYAAIMNASTAGNMLFHGPLAASKTVGAGDTLTFAIGGITATLA